MSEKVVQDSDEEDAGYVAPSNVEASQSRNGINEFRARAKDSHNGSSDSLEGKIDDIQLFLLRDVSAQRGGNIICEERQSEKGSLILPSLKRRRLSHYSKTSRYYSEDPYMFLQQSRRLPYDDSSTNGDEPASTKFQTCSQPLTARDAPDFEQNGDVESLGDGSSTIPYGSLTQKRLMDQAVANLDPQTKVGTWDAARTNDIVEDDNLLSPLSSPCAPQGFQKGAAQSPTFGSQLNLKTGCELLSPSDSFPRMMNANPEVSSKPVLPLGRKKRFETEPMHNTSRFKDDSDDELSFSAGILSAVPHSDSKNINARAISCSRKNITRYDDEPDDINVHDHIPKGELDQAQCDLPRECYIQRPTRSRSRSIKVEEIDHPESPKNLARNQNSTSSPSESVDLAVSNNLPLKSTGSNARDEKDRRPLSMKQKEPYECDWVKTRIPTPCELASLSSQGQVRIVSECKIKHLAEMGFCSVKAEEALRSQNGHMDKAIQELLDCSEVENEQTDLKNAGFQEGRKTSRRLRKGKRPTEDDKSTEQNNSASDRGSCAPEHERISNRVIKTAQVEIFKSRENLSRDNTCTRIGILSQETPYNVQSSSSDDNLSASNDQLSDYESSKNPNENLHLKKPEHVRNIENQVSDNKICFELPEKKKRGRPRKRAKVDNINVIEVHEDPIIQAEDLVVKEPSPKMGRSLTPLLDYNNNSIDIKNNEGCPPNAINGPKTPPSNSYAGTDSSPLTMEKSKKTRKHDHGKMSNHSPLSKSHVPYRVGLSRSAKITPLLRSLKK